MWNDRNELRQELLGEHFHGFPDHLQSSPATAERYPVFSSSRDPRNSGHGTKLQPISTPTAASLLSREGTQSVSMGRAVLIHS